MRGEVPSPGRGGENRRDPPFQCAAARFAGRVATYSRFRPGYPDEVLDVLRRHTGLSPEHAVADIGSGTGISAELFLRAGHTVFGVEPNEEMRTAAEERLAHFPRFRSVAGSAEATTLRDGSAHLIVAAQAFHWFDRERARAEFLRVLAPGGWVALLWNTRLETTPFLSDLERLLQEFGTDYRQIRHTTLDPGELTSFLSPREYQAARIGHVQRLDLEGLRGLLGSFSYLPAPDHPDASAMLQSLERLFREHAQDGMVTIEYESELHLGRPD